MKFTGFTSSLALAGFACSAALPALSGVDSVDSAVNGVEGTLTNGVVGPVLSTAGGLAGATKREDLAALGSTVQTVPSIANGAVAIAGSGAGTAESLVSGAVGSVEGAVAPRGDLAGLGSTVQAVPSVANSAMKIAAGAVGSAVPAVVHIESTVSGATKRQARGPADAVEQSVTGTLAALSSNPNGLFGALTELKHAADLGEITSSQLAEVPALHQIIILLDL
ncbi:unnamed protein product [Penicillium salamii]|uniref:Uncharacterized protein n=1 Tax=Penicillium salamii TaxID=1612424 RepID=A0A9W4NBN5_9EURO|nr:unnamed protein product [Penicillium salamii]CAG8025828.1 unnamed protein product [Penicillium salamii]CAG8038381.1 unnamed protein product [Penicillium salamii]CAG8060280.1 unnamed protein product [Penicillium salamii]CAG8088201.1 unnamed protein product [Penicillium salamii]